MTNSELEEKIGKYRAMLYRLAYSYTGNHSDSEDITQETFIRLFTRSPRFESEKAEKAWLVKVTLNRCKGRNMLKWNRSRSELDENIPSESELAEEYIDLENALKKLKPDHRAAIYLHYYEGLSTAEIASHLGISVTAVTTRLQRGREKLKSFLEDN